jgi:Ran GTPase-activating protein (RanGAP) involved in mRNA processing and transport
MKSTSSGEAGLTPSLGECGTYTAAFGEAVVRAAVAAAARAAVAGEEGHLGHVVKLQKFQLLSMALRAQEAAKKKECGSSCSTPGHSRKSMQQAVESKEIETDATAAIACSSTVGDAAEEGVHNNNNNNSSSKIDSGSNSSSRFPLCCILTLDLNCEVGALREGNNVLQNAKILAAAAPLMPHLQQLLLKGWDLGAEGLQLLLPAAGKHWGGLEELHLGVDWRADGLGHKGMAVLAKAAGEGALPLLRKLDLTYGRLGDEGAEALAKGALESCSWPLLQQLVLARCEISNAGVTAIAKASVYMQQLEVLDVSYNAGVDDIGIALVAKLGFGWRKLQSLDLSGCSIGDGGAAALAKHCHHWPLLTRLVVGHAGLGPSGAKSIRKAVVGQWQGIEELVLDGNKGMGDEGLLALLVAGGGGTGSSSSSNHTAAAAAGGVSGSYSAYATNSPRPHGSQCSTPGYLSRGASGNHAGTTAIAAAAAASVKDAAAAGGGSRVMSGRSEGGGFLQSSTSISGNHSPFKRLSAPGWGGPVAWQQLKKLGLSETGLTAQGVGNLAMAAKKLLPVLEELDLSNNSTLGGEALQVLGKHAAFSFGSLKRLDLSRIGLGAGGLGLGGLAAGGVGSWMHLEQLWLRDCGIGDVGMQELATCQEAVMVAADLGQVGCFPSLQVIELLQEEGGAHSHGGACLGPAGAAALMDLLKPCGEIRVITLAGHKICAAGVAAIAAGAEQLQELRELNLRYNGIGADGAAALAWVAEKGYWRQLKTLDLHSNAIGSEGVRALVQSAKMMASEVVAVAKRVATLSEVAADPRRKTREVEAVEVVPVGDDEHEGMMVEEGSDGEGGAETPIGLRSVKLGPVTGGGLGTKKVEKKVLRGWQQLEVLDLSDNDIGRAGYEELGKMQTGIWTNLQVCGRKKYICMHCSRTAKSVPRCA